MILWAIRRSFELAKIEGWGSVFGKGLRFIRSRVASRIAGNSFGINTGKYWDFRMKWDWEASGGGDQTRMFAASFFAVLPPDKCAALKTLKSVLDFGCATGESVPLFSLFLPHANIYLHDISQYGVRNAVKKYSRFFPVARWEKYVRCDLVYCSNVVEHVPDPKSLISDLAGASNKLIVIQAPWEELHSDGNKINPTNPLNEHVWTIDDGFFDRNFPKVGWRWERFIGRVPMAWDGGQQVYFVGEKIADA